MKMFYKMLFNPEKEKRFFYRIYKMKKTTLSAWYRRHTQNLKHAGLGGKNHIIGKGHVPWNRKGRW